MGFKNLYKPDRLGLGALAARFAYLCNFPSDINTPSVVPWPLK